MWVGLLALLAGCPNGDLKEDEAVRKVLARTSLMPVVGPGDALRGAAVVVRTTYDWVVAVAILPPGDDTLFLALGDERVPAQVTRLGRDLVVLRAPRAERDLRPVYAVGHPKPGEELLLLTVGSGPSLVSWSSEVQEASEKRVILSAPEVLDDAAAAARGLRGGIALTARGALVGIVREVGEDGQPVVVPCQRMLQGRLMKQVRAAGGADQLWAGDGFLTYRVGVARVTSRQLPRISDEWGGPDFFLALDMKGRKAGKRERVGRIEITPGKEPKEPVLISLSARRPLVHRLVERDVNLTDGDTEEELAHPVTVTTPRRKGRVTFIMRPSVLRRYREAGALRGPRRLRLEVSMKPVDPERRSGEDATPLGASRLRLRRVGSGSVDLRSGDATDFWSFQVAQPGPMLFFLFRHRMRDGVVAEGVEPGRRAPLFRIAPEPRDERRLLVALCNPKVAGPVLVRVRQVVPRGQASYSLIPFPREQDPFELIRVLFGLVGREAGRARAAFLGSRAFAGEIAAALKDVANLDEKAVALSLLEILGPRTRVSEARHLALNLMELHFQPPLPALEAVRREERMAGRGQGAGARARDAGLLLALRRPGPRSYLPVYLGAGAGEKPGDRTKRIKQLEEARKVLQLIVMDAAGDRDPRIRLRALTTAARLVEPALLARLRRDLRRKLQGDPSPMVQRALETYFPLHLRRKKRSSSEDDRR